MEYSTGMFISNLPTGISEDNLKNELLRIFEGVEGVENLSVKVFQPKGYIQKAVASGYICKLSELQQTGAGAIILKTGEKKGRTLRWFNDKGDKRDEFGDFLVPDTAEKRRAFQMLHGQTYRKVTLVFSDEFWGLINPNVYDGIRSETVNFNLVNLDRTKFGEVACVKTMAEIGYDYTAIKFASVLDTIQAIRFINSNDEICFNGQFFSKVDDDRFYSPIQHRKGLGHEGVLLKIKEETKNSVLPLDKLDPDILNNDLMDLDPDCLRCKTPYELIGVNVDLNFLSGKCANCVYSSTLDIMDKTRAFFWPGEDFTRLSVVSLNSKELQVWHYPMKHSEAYTTAGEYRDVILPLLYNEWKFNSRPFKAKNACVGILYEDNLVEVLEDNGRLVDFHGMKVKILQTDFWQLDNRFSINLLTIEFTVRTNYGQDVACKRKVKLTDFTEYQEQTEEVGDQDGQKGQCSERFLVLSFQAILEHKYKPLLSTKVHIIPKMDKLQYEASKQSINSWAKGKTGHLPAQKLLLDANFSCNWRNITNIPEKPTTNRSNWLMKVQLNKLNDEQRHALLTAVSSCLSFIHGPPGTGKTTTAAQIIVTLVHNEKGIIIGSAPSNVACDGLCLAIKNTSIICKPKVLRIYAKRREVDFLKGAVPVDEALGFDTLHDMVRKSSNWLKTKVLRDIDLAIRASGRHLLTQDELQLYMKHVADIEKEIIAKYDVLVCTFSALCDRRVINWNSAGKITTVIADEAGQATQPDTLPLYMLNADRYVFIGDHLQLSAGLRSSSSRSGLQVSIMEWVANAKKSSSCSVPWSTLLEQRRMAPSIRRLVSDFTYHGDLRDAEIISTRQYMYEKIYAAVPEIEGHNVVVFSHRDFEERAGESYKNPKQADLIAGLVKKLLLNGIPEKHITVLSLYEAQRVEISKKLKNGVQVKNTDGFQGRESEIVIVSLTRSNNHGGMGFTSNQNRLNVSFSRARFQLFIYLDLETIRMNGKKTFKSLTKILEETALIIQL